MLQPSSHSSLKENLDFCQVQYVVREVKPFGGKNWYNMHIFNYSHIFFFKKKLAV
jgi:hypothetical protein